jgi:hypothetical protein
MQDAFYAYALVLRGGKLAKSQISNARPALALGRDARCEAGPRRDV